MAESSSARVRLAAELVHARELAGVSGRALATRIGVSQSTLSRIENAKVLPSRPQVQAYADAGVPVDDRVFALLDAAHRETRTWGDLLDGRAHLQGDVRDRDVAATAVRNFQPTLVPGLLQTAAYARAVLEMGRTDVAPALAARMERQQVLYGSGRRFEFLMTEQALRWSPAPGATDGLAERIASLATLDAVNIMVLPEGAQVGAPAWHNFVIREVAGDEPAYVTTELVHGAQEVRDPASVDAYLRLWELLRNAAATGDAAVALVRAAAS